MMSKFRLVLMVLLSLTLAGCGNSATKRLIGKWKWDPLKGIAKDFGIQTEMGMIFEFKSDQTLNVSATGIPAPFSGSMTWKTLESQGDKLTIEITNPKENTPSKVQITFTDNDHLQFIPPDMKTKPMEFERVKEK